MVWLSAAERARLRQKARALMPQHLNDCVAFWDFQEESSRPRTSRGPRALELQLHGTVERVAGGVFGRYAARFSGEGYLCAPRALAPELAMGGVGAAVSVVAWLKREKRPVSGNCECVAGVWNEHGLRQYALFLNLHIWNSLQQVGAHVSRTGGPTPGHKYCMEAALGQTPVPFDEWVCLALTFDGHQACAYLNGQLDERQEHNPLPYPGPLFDGGAQGADFTVGAVQHPVSIDEDGTAHSSVMSNSFLGVLGGLAVYRRALTSAELWRLSALTPSKSTT